MKNIILIILFSTPVVFYPTLSQADANKPPQVCYDLVRHKIVNYFNLNSGNTGNRLKIGEVMEFKKVTFDNDKTNDAIKVGDSIEMFYSIKTENGTTKGVYRFKQKICSDLKTCPLSEMEMHTNLKNGKCEIDKIKVTPFLAGSSSISPNSRVIYTRDLCAKVNSPISGPQSIASLPASAFEEFIGDEKDAVDSKRKNFLAAVCEGFEKAGLPAYKSPAGGGGALPSDAGAK